MTNEPNGRYRSAINPPAIPSQFNCLDCYDTGTATVTLWGVIDNGRYEQRDVQCHCPLGAGDFSCSVK